MTRRNELRITTRSERGTVVISLHGAMTTDSLNQGELEREVLKLLDLGFRRFVLDLEQIELMHHEGIEYLVFLYTRVVGRGGEISLVNVPRKVKDILQILSIASLFET